MKACFLSLVRSFRKNFSLKKSKEKGAASPKIKTFMPKISKTALKKEKRTNIFNINPIVSTCA